MEHYCISLLSTSSGGLLHVLRHRLYLHVHPRRPHGSVPGQRGNRFAFIQFTDQTGVFEVTFFSDVLAEANDLLDSEKPLLISANLKVEDNGPRLLAARVQLLDDAIAAWHGGVALWLPRKRSLCKALWEERT